MARINAQGFDELSEMFQELSPIPDSVLTGALDAMATVGERAVKSSGESMGVRDPESSVHILDRITHTKPKRTKDGGYTDVTFSGTRTRGRTKTRNAEIAFVNEYGKRGQAPRPFIRVAQELSADQAADAGEKVIFDWWDRTAGP